MHSFVLLALASSALALPVDFRVVKAFAPVAAQAANVKAGDDAVANHAVDDNKIVRRGNLVAALVPAKVSAANVIAVDDNVAKDVLDHNNVARSADVGLVKLVAPVKVDAANVNAHDDYVANDVANGNKIASRDAGRLVGAFVRLCSYLDYCLMLMLLGMSRPLSKSS